MSPHNTAHPRQSRESTDDSTPPPSRRQKLIYQVKIQRPRWVLHMQATFWRVLMGLGMFFHRLAPPRPPKPDFWRTIPTTISGIPGEITLYFYVPRDYNTQRRLWTNRPLESDDDEEGEEEEGEGAPRGHGTERRRRRSSTFSNIGNTLRRRSMSIRKWGGYPVVINFHGGGFTLGTATDDARWCGTVVDEVDAVVVSVDYRLAPECPFPTAVEDGVDAVLWVHKHAQELGIDKSRIALSGFSSGGNMSFTVPLRLYDQQTGFAREEQDFDNDSRAPTAHGSASASQPPATSYSAATSSTLGDWASTAPTEVPPNASRIHLLERKASPPPEPGHPIKSDTTVTESLISEISIRCIVPWYPSLDYTRTREERRATNLRTDHELPALFTDLFDDSYLHPPKDVSLDSPYLSPGVAPTSLLRNALPRDIIMHTCEWDMLLDEGQAFRDRLTSAEIHRNVIYKMIPNVPHGWDKAPNPWKPTPGVREHYLAACKEMRRILGQHDLPERATAAGPSAAPRGSVQVVR